MDKMIPAVAKDTRFRLDDATAKELANTYGTPLYVVDERHFRERIREFKKTFHDAYHDSEISFASKANSTLALLKIAAQEGCGIDCASEGELRAAFAAGVSPAQCHLHGNNKTEAELRLAIESEIGYIVADNFGEIEKIAAFAREALKNPPVVLRLAPGVDPITHAKISTGQADTKFGFNIADGSAEKATRLCLEKGINLIGYHCHVGSQLLDSEAQRAGGELIARFAKIMAETTGFQAQYLNFGGGLGVRYTDQDQPPTIEEYTALVVKAIEKALEGSKLRPRLGQEPGRSLISDSQVTLYKVGVVKTVPAQGATKTYVGVDGGLSDNPRPGLYGSRYTVIPAGKENEPTMTVTVCGKHCETDNLFENIRLPVSTAPGDILQVLSTGAYNASMANNYNRYPRPVAVLRRLDQTFSVIQRAETWDEMFARETLPVDLGPEGLA